MGDIASLIAVLGGAVAVYRWGSSWYRRGWGSHRDLRNKLDELATGATREYVENLFGPAAFRRVRDGGRLVECVYWTRHAWVQVLFDTLDAVALFSLTVVDPTFRYQTDLWTADQAKIIIGKSRFSELHSEPSARRYWYGASRGHYAEQHYWGNPGLYQYYVFAFNDAGFGVVFNGESFADGEWAPTDKDHPLYGRETPMDDDIRALRAETTINTLVVIGPEALDAGDISPLEWPGVDYNHIRTLHSTASFRRTRFGRAWKQSEPVPLPTAEPESVAGHEQPATDSTT